MYLCLRPTHFFSMHTDIKTNNCPNRIQIRTYKSRQLGMGSSYAGTVLNYYSLKEKKKRFQLDPTLEQILLYVTEFSKGGPLTQVRTALSHQCHLQVSSSRPGQLNPTFPPRY